MPLDSKEIQPPVKQIKPMTTFAQHQPPVPVTNHPTSTSMFSDKPMSICSPHKNTVVPSKKPRQSFSQILMEIVNEENAKKKLEPVKTPT